MADHELYGHCRRSVVEIFHVKVGEEDYCCGDSAVFFLHESGFVYLIGRRTCTHGSTELDVVFQDGTNVRAANDTIRNVGDFFGAGCFLPEGMDTTSIKAVEFYEEKLLTSDYVYTLTFKVFEEPPDLTPGFVSTSEELFFYHTCRAASTMTKDGAPVFKKDGRFVGLCYGEICGMLAASTVRSLALSLSESYATNDMDINEILQHIYASAIETREQNDGGQTSNTPDDQESEH